jgi:hypothetical protein
VAVEIGIVGPHDLVDAVAASCEEQPGVTAQRFDYDHESQSPAVVEAHGGQVDAWLFTGVVPYTLARESNVLTRPATFVDYSGATLLQAAVRLLRDGHDPTRISIDTVNTADVTTTFTEAGLPVERVRSLPYRSGLTSADVMAFHRRQRRGAVPATVAVTCLSSVYEALRHEMPTLRLAPSNYSVRTALRQLLRRLADRHDRVHIGFGLGRSAAEAEKPPARWPTN